MPIFQLHPESFATLLLAQRINLKTLAKLYRAINPFVPNAPFLYPLKISDNLTVFWCFQGVQKEYIGNKWVNWHSKTTKLDILWPWRFLKYSSLTTQSWLVTSFFIFVFANANGNRILIYKLHVGHLILSVRNLT